LTSREEGSTVAPILLEKDFTMARTAVAGLLLLGLCISSTSAQEGVTLKKPEAKPKDPTSYAIGWNIGQDFLANGFQPADLASDDFLAGVQDAIARSNSRLNEEEMRAAFAALRERMNERIRMRAKTNSDEAAKFLEANKAKEGVISLPSGLQYKVLKAGKGAQPTLTSEVKVHYEGKLIDGTVFDSSIKRGEPTEFPVGGVIPGWTEALQRMKVGDKWQVFIPPNLAYGERGQGGDIGPNQLLIFEVELLDVK
jgi:FKBP-type peptidyl-prolyl cis-trans isomerase